MENVQLKLVVSRLTTLTTLWITASLDNRPPTVIDFPELLLLDYKSSVFHRQVVRGRRHATYEMLARTGLQLRRHLQLWPTW